MYILLSGRPPFAGDNDREIMDKVAKGKYDLENVIYQSLQHVLYFHRVRYDKRMRDGRTLIQRIYDDHFEGYHEVEVMEKQLSDLLPLLPESDRSMIAERIVKQKDNAREWRDVINTFFHRLSGIDDIHQRKIYD